MTFSIAARCPDTGRIGLAVASSSPAVAARCAHARAGVGAVLSQNVTDPRLGPQGLDLLARGASPAEVIQIFRRVAPHIAHRQLAVVDAEGRTATFSGARSLGIHATAEGRGAVAAGNLLAHDRVPDAILAGFAAATGPLGGRIVAAMRAGLDAGGEAGPIHSIGLLLVDRAAWPIADLRVDWHDDPVGELERLWALWAPQMDAYIARALDPDGAPSYGVPGDR